jgi:hypothetical protein
MKPQSPQPQTITAKQATIAASTFPGDHRQKQYQRKRIRAYGAINRAELKKLGAHITLVMN